MNSPTAIVFDLDGTLIDSSGDIAAAANHALTMTGRRVLPVTTILRFAGDGARPLCARASGLSESDPELDMVVDAYLDFYADHPIVNTRWMPHARQALEELRDCPLAICTNKPRRTTEIVLAALGVRTLFAVVIAGGDVPDRKPSPGPVLAVAEQLRLAPNQLVVVGDGPQDVESGRRAGTRTIGVEGGFVPRERLAGAHPDVLIGSLAELPSVVSRWRDATVRAGPR
jgi:2-phosphoglycolate phosphatase